jgi:cyclomaltodextrinase
MVNMRWKAVWSALVALSLATTAAAQVSTTFRYEPPPGAPEVESVTLPGSFNGWSTSELPMERQEDGSWAVTVELEPGDHLYKFYINDSWPEDMCGSETWGDPARNFWIDPDADRCEDDGFGGRNAVRVVAGVPDEEEGLGFRHDPADPAHVSTTRSGDEEALSVRFTANAGEVTEARVAVGDESYPMHLQLEYRGREVWRAVLPLETSDYAIVVQTHQGEGSFGPFAAPAEPFTPVAWIAGAVGYQIFPERFWNGDPENDRYTLETDSYNFKDPEHWYWEGPPVLMDEWGGEVLDRHCCHQYFGGDLQGILERLDDLEDLGVTLLYLTPIFESGSAHGYDAHDFFTVAPNFGDEAVLRELLDEAQARGMRVMWDFVPNHVGTGHWAFQDAVKRGLSSPYADWFRFHVDPSEVQVGKPDNAHYDSWWGLGNLPELETRNPEVMEHLLDVTRHWTEFGFDGIRVDVPGDIRNRSEFFPAFRRAAKEVNPEVYLVGEIWQRNPSWLQGDEFDSLMNYAVGQGVIAAFARGTLDGASALAQMAEVYATYPEASTAMQFNIIASHDTARLATMVGGGALGDEPDEETLARQRLAAAMLYALPGMPVTFQGDECAFLGRGEGPQEENRYPVQWEACDTDMLEHYRQLAALKRDLPALHSPTLRGYLGETSTLGFYRGEPGEGELLALFALEAGTVNLPEGTWEDAISGDPVSDRVELEALSWRYLVRR